MSYYYLFWIGESAHNLCVPVCEIATSSSHTMYEYCSDIIDKYYSLGEYVVMSVKTIPTLDGKSVFTQNTCSVHEFIQNQKEIKL